MMGDRIRRAARVAVIALALCAGVGVIPQPVGVLAEDNDPKPPPPKPKDPPPPPNSCAGDRARSACKAAEAVRSLLRELMPPDSRTPAGEAAAAGGNMAAPR